MSRATPPPGDAQLDAQPDDLTTLASELRLACQQISRRVRYEGTLAIAPHKFSVLVRLGQGERTPGELADIERVTAPSMTKTINALADAGLVCRRPHPDDRRQVLVSRTPAGEALYRQVANQRDTWMTNQLSTLTAAQLAQLRRLTPLLVEVASR